MPSLPSPHELQAHGWEIVAEELRRGRGEDHLIIHWFLTPDDAEVHSDAHWFDDRRILKFVGVVIPTLADQLRATMLAVAVPWAVGHEQATLVLVTAASGAPAQLSARRLTRTALADAAPYWRLSGEEVDAPAPLIELVAGLRI